MSFYYRRNPGADPGFFLGGRALVSCSTSTPINHIVFWFFLQNTICVRKPQVIPGGGAQPPHPPLDPPLEPRLTPSTQPTKLRRIPHHNSCSASNLIYMIQCNKCNMQYIGETKRQFSDRFGEQRRSIEKARNPYQFHHPTAVSEHFSLPDHSIKDIEIIPLELINAGGQNLSSNYICFGKLSLCFLKS